MAVPAGARTGIQELKVRLTVEDEAGHLGWTGAKPWSVELFVAVDVCSLVVQPRKDFPVTHWINIESLWDWYKIEPFSDRFWELAEAYVADLTAHGVDVVYSPVFNNRHEIMPRPGQLLRVRKTGHDAWEFDFTDVRRWIRMAVKNGANYLEWTHFFTPAPTSGRHPQRIFERWDGKTGDLLWPPEISSTGDTYRAFLSQFIPQFKKVLEEERIFDRSLFHCADEPDGDVQIADYRKARLLLKELAPWMQVIDAMSDPRFATERLTDMPVPSIVTAPLVGRRDARPGPTSAAGLGVGSFNGCTILRCRSSAWRAGSSTSWAQRFPALGTQLLVCLLHRYDGRSVQGPRKRRVSRSPLWRPFRRLPRCGRSHQFHPLGGLRGKPAGLRAPAVGRYQAGRSVARASGELRNLPEVRGLAEVRTEEDTDQQLTTCNSTVYSEMTIRFHRSETAQELTMEHYRSG